MDLFLLFCLAAPLILFLCLPRVALDSLAVSFKVLMGWTATKNIVGSDYTPNTNATTISKAGTLGTSVANAVAGGGDELYSAVTSLAGSASASIDLTALVDILGQAAMLFARVKVILIRVLSVADDAVIGTAAVGVSIDNTVVNGLSSQANSGWFSNAAEGGASGSRFTIPNGGALAFFTPAGAGVLVDGTHKIIKLTNLDGAVTIKVQVSIAGGSN